MEVCQHIRRGRYMDSMCGAPITETLKDDNRTTRVCERGHGVTTVRCACGESMECDHFTNACDCGRDYGHGGNLLAPRSQWGEETGESVSDILAADGDY